jgi:23S rRNA (guanosine2251-2'-O)-methyltransferase
MAIKKTMDELDRLTQQEFQSAHKFPIVLVLDEVRSMHNVGSVFRTADAFGIEEIILCGLTPTPPHRDIQKTALGSTETVQWTHAPSTLEVVAQLHSKGYRVYAIEQAHGSLSLEKFHGNKNQPVAFIFGHEVFGVKEEVIQACDGTIEIPQWGTKHSLNISVSVGIVLWQVIPSFLNS